MWSSDLKPEQLRKVRESLLPKLQYLRRLRERMEMNKFHRHDRLYRDAIRAEEAVNELVLELETLISRRGGSFVPEPFA